MQVYLFLAKGFEETEAILPTDFLYRAGVDITKVAVDNTARKSIAHTDLEVQGSHDITVRADVHIDALQVADECMFILPGGMPGSQTLSQNSRLIELIKVQNEKGGVIAAICAAPGHVLGTHGFLDGKKFTGFPGTQSLAPTAEYNPDVPVLKDGNLITSQGVGTAAHFAFFLVALIKGRDIALEVWNKTLCHHISKEPPSFLCEE